jgi:hypothetical protein
MVFSLVDTRLWKSVVGFWEHRSQYAYSPHLGDDILFLSSVFYKYLFFPAKSQSLLRRHKSRSVKVKSQVQSGERLQNGMLVKLPDIRQTISWLSKLRMLS